MVNKVCIYAICKNEIKYVDQWLGSMSEADYIVVLDTGSTDGTYEKLKNDPRVTKVKRKKINPWRFDVARNESMKLVPEDANILFCTDLDEVLEPGWGDLVRKYWRDDTVRGHYLYVWSHTEIGNPGVTFWYDKMHTRDYKWYFPVHEVLGLKEGFTKTFELEDNNPDRVLNFGDKITLHHYPDQTKSRSNYMDLLKVRVQEDPDECYGWYFLGREYGVYEMYDEALEAFERTLSLPSVQNFPLVKLNVLGYMGDIYTIREDYDQAALCYNLQITESPTHREAYLELAEICNRRGFYRLAIAYVEEAFAKTYQHYDWTERAVTWNEKPYDILCIAYSNLGELDKAIENGLKALQYAPMDKRLQENYLLMIEKRSHQS